MKFSLVVIILILLVSCNSGGNSTGDTVLPTISISVSETKVDVGTSVIVTWQAQNYNKASAKPCELIKDEKGPGQRTTLSNSCSGTIETSVNADTAFYFGARRKDANSDFAYEQIVVSVSFILDSDTSVIAKNADWTPVTKIINGTEMVLIPQGKFTMGSTEEEVDVAFSQCQQLDVIGGRCKRDTYAGGTPVNLVIMNSPYYIDRTEVTRKAYNACVADGVCPVTAPSDVSTQDNQPINRITWFRAAKYCEWRGARLPNEAEWEYAARGPDNLRYPWGSFLVGNEVNHNDSTAQKAFPHWVGSNIDHNDGFANLAPVGSYENASWVGALDMIGNVWEWTSSLSIPYPYNHDENRTITQFDANISETVVIRGSAFDATSESLFASFRGEVNTDIDFDGLGFRCAWSE